MSYQKCCKCDKEWEFAKGNPDSDKDMEWYCDDHVPLHKFFKFIVRFAQLMLNKIGYTL